VIWFAPDKLLGLTSRDLVLVDPTAPGASLTVQITPRFLSPGFGCVPYSLASHLKHLGVPNKNLTIQIRYLVLSMPLSSMLDS
jgi:hypothetical protein